MGKSDRDFTKALTDATYDLITNAGNNDPSAEEIAAHYFEDKTIGGEVIEAVRKKLKQIRTEMEATYPEVPTCLVSEMYYRRFRGRLIVDIDDAHKCIPTGHGKTAWGIKVCADDDDLIYTETMVLNGRKGAGMMRNTGDRTLGAYEAGKLSGETTARVLDAPREAARPKRLELEEELRLQLPESTGEEPEE